MDRCTQHSSIFGEIVMLEQKISRPRENQTVSLACPRMYFLLSIVEKKAHELGKFWETLEVHTLEAGHSRLRSASIV